MNTDGDGMVFDDIRFREPARLRRPDQDPKLACIACQTPTSDDLPIFLDRGPADAIERHALSDTTVELGGVLLGKECVDPATGRTFVWITQALEAKHYANTQASFTYTHDSWEEITRERDRLHPELDVVGWYHTHPNFGIFLSHHDLFIHKNFFDQPLQTAYVVDPIQGTRGFFQWSNGEMRQVGGFHLCADRTDRGALVRLVDQLENLSGEASPGGASLSPRLEAELIKMLNRPAPPSDLGGGTGLTLALLLGFLGALGLALLAAAGFWLHAVNEGLREQADALAVLKREVEESSTGRKLAGDLLQEKVGGETPELFIARYEKLARARDEAKNRLGAQQSALAELGVRVQQLTSSTATLEGELATARTELALAEADRKAAPKLHERLALLERNEGEIQRLRGILASSEGEAATQTYDALEFYKMTTYAGAFATALLALTSAYFFIRPSDREEREAPRET